MDFEETLNHLQLDRCRISPRSSSLWLSAWVKKLILPGLITHYYKAAFITAFHCVSAGVFTSSLQTLVILQHSSMCNCMVRFPLPLPTHTLVRIISNSSFLWRARLQLQKSEHPGNFYPLFSFWLKNVVQLIDLSLLETLHFSLKFSRNLPFIKFSWPLEQWTLWNWQLGAFFV